MTPSRRLPRAVGRCVALAAIALATTGVGAAPTASSATASPLHVFVVVMENRSFTTVMSNPQFAALARRGDLATNYYAVAHPSLPNYLALVSGGTWGVTSDCVTCYLNRPNLGAQLSAAHVSWDAYVEGIPSPCFLAPYGGVDYAAKHNPWRYFESVRSSRSVCSHLRPLSDLAPTLAKPASSVPDFVWVTPDLCHDGHDCSTAVAAAWLTGFVNEVTSSSAFRAGGALFVTFDEGVGNAGVSPRGEVSATSGGGRVATILISAATRPGSTYSRPANHYSLLATVDQIFGLARLGHARGAATLTKMFNKTASLTG